MPNHFRAILLLISLNTFGIQYAIAQDTLCLTAREYNDLLVRGNCTDIIKADSVLLWDKSKEISLQSEYIKGQKSQIAICESQVKKSKRQIIKYKFGMFGAIIVGVVTNVYLIFR